MESAGTIHINSVWRPWLIGLFRNSAAFQGPSRSDSRTNPKYICRNHTRENCVAATRAYREEHKSRNHTHTQCTHYQEVFSSRWSFVCASFVVRVLSALTPRGHHANKVRTSTDDCVRVGPRTPCRKQQIRQCLHVKEPLLATRKRAKSYIGCLTIPRFGVVTRVFYFTMCANTTLSSVIDSTTTNHPLTRGKQTRLFTPMHNFDDDVHTPLILHSSTTFRIQSFSFSPNVRRPFPSLMPELIILCVKATIPTFSGSCMTPTSFLATSTRGS